LGTMTGAAISVTSSTANHYCGQHSLEVTTTFIGTSGNTTKAEVLIDLPPNLQNLSGKTITIHVAAVPDAMPSAYLALTLRTAVGDMTISPSVRPLTGDWKTQTYEVPSNDGGTTMVTSLAFQMFDTNGYQGKLYIDDVDIH
ncbi:MAG TPA: hypothetical protein VMU50_11430, partial [Polyangia bacterium]|nr:hypothetical protein [Polyangia bacterium]